MLPQEPFDNVNAAVAITRHVETMPQSASITPEEFTVLQETDKLVDALPLIQISF